MVLNFALSDINAKSTKYKKVSLTTYKSNRQIKRVKTTDLGNDTLFTRRGPDGERLLTVWGLLLAGSVSRSAAATLVHPLNVMKIMLQRREGNMPEFTWDGLMRGSGSQLLWSIPHGAFSFAVIENTKKRLGYWSKKLALEDVIPKHILIPLMDFLSSCFSTPFMLPDQYPQMVTTDRIMANVYPNLPQAIRQIFEMEGLQGFYTGWLPSLLQKIPSYALTWMIFQQLKLMFRRYYARAGTGLENTLLGSCAAAGACCIMILLTQSRRVS